MPPERAKLLAELLTEVYEKDNGFIPDPAYKPFHKLCSWGAIEVLIVSPNGKKILLRKRCDIFYGWHVIGGYVKPKESIQQFCNRALCEDVGLNSGVAILGQIAVSKWLNHPFSFPLCTVVVCNLLEDIVERPDLKWFSVDNLPLGEMIHPNQESYLLTYLDYLKQPERICPIIGT